MTSAAGHPLEREKYISLSTFRKTGVPVSTPVWVGVVGDELAVISVDNVGKIKRLRRNPQVAIRACDVRGKVAAEAPTYTGTARVVRDEAGLAQVRRAIGAKYGLIGKAAPFFDAIGRRIGLRTKPRAGILITLDSAGG